MAAAMSLPFTETLEVVQDTLRTPFAPPSRGPLRPGTRLDHFTIEAELGRGAMGIVYVAHDRALDRRVALKVLVRDEESALDRFFREARSQAKLASPHVVAIHFIGRAGQSAYFAMELVVGEALDAGLDRGEVLDPERARLLMIEVARGLAAARAAGFIHRDIKPSNLLLDAEGHVKIADFGIVKPITKVEGTFTGEGVVLGTPMYMAPEQTRGEAVDHRADMYALGCTFFHLASGRAPYEGKNTIELIANHFTAPVPSLREHAPRVPHALSRVVARLMSKDPSARFDTYEELIGALERAATRNVEHAGFAVRAAAALIDLAISGVVVGLLGPFALGLYLLLLVGVQGRYGQTLGMYLLHVRAERISGRRLGFGRALARVLVSAWLPVLVAIAVLATQGHGNLLDLLRRASRAGDLKALVMAFAVSNGALTVLYAWCLGLCAIHPQKRAVHDLVAGSRVVHVLSDRA